MTIIIIIEKYDFNDSSTIVMYKTFKEELENNIALMTNIIKSNTINELINCIDYFEKEDINENLSGEKIDNKIEKNSNISWDTDSLQSNLNMKTIIIY